MHVLIISTGTAAQESFWQERLQLLRGTLTSTATYIVAVYEDWEGGAGNGLGTLYAYQKGREKIRRLYGKDIQEEQKNGASIAIYHTAGQGKRLAPLTACEQFNKSAVKLPIISDDHPISILEAVIKQTLPYLNSRPGRLSVFWGDQIFCPSHPPQYIPRHHIDLLAKLQPFPTEQQWDLHQLSNYGLVGIDSTGNAKNLEKSSYKTVLQHIHNHSFPIEGGFGISLGSFSLSYSMTTGLLELFQQELLQKNIKMDSDTEFWIPLVWDVPMHGNPKHHERMQLFKRKFQAQHQESALFGVVDIGANSFWWDYGTIQNYFANNLKLTQQTVEGQAMRQFFGISSTVINSRVKSGNIVNSVLIGVEAEHLDIRDCIIINSRLSTLSAQNCLLYNVQESAPLTLTNNTVRADVNIAQHNFPLYTTLDRDGKEDWSQKLPGNPMSYADFATSLLRKEVRSQNPEA